MRSRSCSVLQLPCLYRLNFYINPIPIPNPNPAHTKVHYTKELQNEKNNKQTNKQHHHHHHQQQQQQQTSGAQAIKLESHNVHFVGSLAIAAVLENLVLRND